MPSGGPGASAVITPGGANPSGLSGAATPTARNTSSSARASSASAATERPVPVLLPPAVSGLTWRAAGTTVRGVPVTYIATTAHGSIALLWMNTALLRFRFIPGYVLPEHSPVLPADRRPSTWVPLMAAAFNGGFKLSDGAGGYFYAGHIVRALRPGLAALTITNAGRISVVSWGREQVTTAGLAVVRENLPLLVDAYSARTSASDTNRTWGVANGGLPHANRSALGQLYDGSVVYAFGAEVTPSEMAAAMVQIHARTAMMLDMNKSWPGGFVYARRGASIAGQRILAPIWHSPSVYYGAFTKDFIVALVQP
jgi:hypothetical protein